MRARLLPAMAVLTALAPLGAISAPRAPLAPVIVAADAHGAFAAAADGSRAAELPWLEAGDTDPAVSPDGRRVAFSSMRHGNRELYVADAAGGEVLRLTVSARADDRHPAWSPDGRLLAWESRRAGSGGDVLVMGADGRGRRRLVGGPGDDGAPAWSPDGRRVAFVSDRDGRRRLWVVPARGGQAEPLAEVAGADDPAWAPDGRRIAFSRPAAGGADLWVATVADGAAQRLTRGPGADTAPDFSPDGARLVFTRARGGAAALWTVRADGSRARPLSPARSGREPDWAEAVPAVAPAPGELLPDLDQRAPTGLVVVASGGGYRLGFDSATENRGRGPLVIRAFRAPGETFMRAHQVVESRRGGRRAVRDVGRLHYELHPPHFHWHLQDFVRYELVSVARPAVVIRDRKTGFCLIDRYGRASGRVPGTGPPRFVGDCAAGRREARVVEEGSSVGYVDRYPAFFHGQDLRLTGLAPGRYLLVQRANPRRTMRELRYTNNAASLLLRLTWPRGRSAAPVVRVLRRCPDAARCAAGG